MKKLSLYIFLVLMFFTPNNLYAWEKVPVPDYVDKVSLTAWLTAGMRSNVTRIKKLRERVQDAKKKLTQVK